MGFPLETFGLIPEKNRVKIIVDKYRDAEDFVINQMNRITLQNFSRKLEKDIKRKIEIYVSGLNAYVQIWSKVTIRDAYSKAKRKSESTLLTMGFEKEGTEDVHKKAVIAGVKKTTFHFLNLNNSIIQTNNIFLGFLNDAKKSIDEFKFKVQEFDTDIFFAGIKKIVFDALIKIDSTTKAGFKFKAIEALPSIQRSIQTYFTNTYGGFDYIIINDRRYKMHKYARMVARTEIRKVQTDAVLNSCKQYNDDLVRFSTHATPCPICSPLEGQIYSISGKHPVYPKLTDQTPPIHPHCEHNLDPTSDVVIKRQKKRGDYIPKPNPITAAERIQDLKVKK